MPISAATYKMLWGKAAGRCSNLACGRLLVAKGTKDNCYVVGEMAHIIADGPEGPRGDGVGGDNSYENLVLLCPTCHESVDKDPESFPAALLRKWKQEHEQRVDKLLGAQKFNSIEAFRQFVRPLLTENHYLWESLGPHSEIAQANPNSNLIRLWELRKSDTIVPNNSRIVAAIDASQDLFDDAQCGVCTAFKLHAGGFAAHQLETLDKYPLFPQAFADLIDVK